MHRLKAWITWKVSNTMITGEDISWVKSLLLPAKCHHPILLTTLTKTELPTPAQHSHSSPNLFYLPNSMYYACLLFFFLNGINLREQEGCFIYLFIYFSVFFTSTSWIPKTRKIRNISRGSIHICWMKVLMNKSLVRGICFLFCWLGE